MSTLSSAPHPGYIGSSRFGDVWDREDAICAFCATPIRVEDKHCPHCRQLLIRQQFRYAKPSPNLHIFWVLLLACGQLFLINAATALIGGAGWPVLALHLLLSALFMGLALAVYLRQFWALATSIIVLLILLFLRGLGVLNLIEQLLPLPSNSVEAMLTGPFVNGLIDLLIALQLLALALALLWAVFLVGPDFERVSLQQVARVRSGLHSAADYDLAARQDAQEGMWANAVLHWQRAAAHAPNQWRYQVRLGQAYARLGFFDRSLNVLHGIEKRVSNPEVKAQVAGIVETVSHYATIARRQEVDKI